MDADALTHELAGMDIYLLDQVVRGRFPQGCAILDAGCGGGRNLAWFARNGYQVHAVDANHAAINAVVAHGLLPADRAVVAPLDRLPLGDASFDAVLCIAVLHFMPDEAAFAAAVNELWRVLKPGGLLFARLSTTHTIEPDLRPLGRRRFITPGGQEWFMPDLQLLQATQERLGAEMAEPIRTVNVHNQRTMTNWILRKRPLP